MITTLSLQDNYIVITGLLDCNYRITTLSLQDNYIVITGLLNCYYRITRRSLQDRTSYKMATGGNIEIYGDEDEGGK